VRARLRFLCVALLVMSLATACGGGGGGETSAGGPQPEQLVSPYPWWLTPIWGSMTWWRWRFYCRRPRPMCAP
jgi:hypothetical protein